MILVACRICGSNRLGQPLSAREMMFGTRESFDYVRCDECGTLQIAEFPTDMTRHYPQGEYYSFNNTRRISPLRRYVRRLAASTMIGRPDREPTGPGRFDRLRRVVEPWISVVPRLRRDTSILDVGSGEGARLDKLAVLGFTNLTGVDPFMPENRVGRSAGGAILHRCELDEVEGKFELVMMHHSLEHFEDPARMLRLAGTRLAEGGHILVRIPILQDWVWERYGTNWAQLDPPRHFYLFTPDSFIGLAARCGLRCQSHGFDGMGWAIAWSEAYGRDIALKKPSGEPNTLPFDAEAMEHFEEEARLRNCAGEGDSGWFVLEAAPTAPA